MTTNKRETRSVKPSSPFPNCSSRAQVEPFAKDPNHATSCPERTCGPGPKKTRSHLSVPLLSFGPCGTKLHSEPNMIRSSLILAAILLALASTVPAQAADEGRLEIHAVDKDTGQPIAARVHLKDIRGNVIRAPKLVNVVPG